MHGASPHLLRNRNNILGRVSRRRQPMMGHATPADEEASQNRDNKKDWSPKLHVASFAFFARRLGFGR